MEKPEESNSMLLIECVHNWCLMKTLGYKQCGKCGERESIDDRG